MSWDAFTTNSHPEPPLPEPSSCPSNLCDGVSMSFQQDVLAEYSSHPLDLGQHRESVSSSSSSGSSLWEPCSPTGRRLSTTTMDTTVLDTDVDADSSEELWNLVAYHVPWGPGYEGYEKGTLPGPEGTCIFLRSPTPLKRQRTTQACDKCRERKAKCSGSRPSCARCISRGVACVYSTSTVLDAQFAPLRTSLRRSSHSGYSASKPSPIKVPARTRLRRRSSLMESVITTVADSLRPSEEKFKEMPYPSAFYDGPAMALNGDIPGYSLSLLGDDFESPIEPPTSSSFVSSSSSDSAMYQSPEMSRALPLSFPQDTSTLLYTHSLSELDEYRFPPVEEQKHLPIPQLPLAPSSFDPHSHAPVIENPGNSALMPVTQGGLEVMWHDFRYNQGSSTIPEISSSSSDAFANAGPDSSSELSHAVFYSPPVIVQPGLGDPLPAHFQR